MRRFISFYLLFCLLARVGQTAVAQSTPIPFEPTAPIIIEPPLWRMEGLEIAYQRVNVTIDSQVATTHIDQLFVNDNDWVLEGTYFFPLPPETAVSQLTMWVDGIPIEAKILPKEQARAIYDEIVRHLRDPALLEYVDSSAIQANVFPIPPHAERRIEIEYSQILPVDNGLMHYIYPQATHVYSNIPLNNQSIRVEVASQEPIRAVYSPSHPIALSRPSDFQAVVGYEAADVVADQDFELYVSLSPENIGLNLLSYRESGEDGFFLLLVAPSINAEEVVAKDVILVLDTSGSMEGDKLAQAQQAARYVVDNLNAEDRFNVVTFSTGTRHFAQELVPAGQAAAAGSFIDRLEAVGGTNISLALLEAVAQANASRPTTLIFLTDGLATEGITDTELLLDNVAQSTPANVRLFAFGVGDDVDTTLLDTLTQNHRGTTSYVRPFEKINEEVSSFYAKISTPVLADISLDFGGVVVEQLYPATLPDLFAGSQLVLTGRYREGGPATITLRGTVNGREQLFRYSDNLFRSSGGDSFIPRLWATRAIGHLLTEIRLHGENSELVQSVVNLSVRYGIITPYTSYLIEEDDILTQAGRERVVEESMAVEVTRVVSGEIAIAEADAAAEMAAAEAPLPAPMATLLPGQAEVEGFAVAAETAVRLVGSKTFIWREGVWLDTAYDPEKQTAQPINFASPAYFDLLTAVPGIGQYLALGEQVLVVVEGKAYQIVPSGGAEAGTAVVLVTPMVPTNRNAEPTPIPVVPRPINTNPAEPTGRTGFSLWWLLLAIPLFLGLGLLAGRRSE